MRIPNYKKYVNHYTQDFLDQFWDLFNTVSETDKINLKERNNINQIISKYYSMFFYVFHQNEPKLLHFPEYALDFNVMFLTISVEAARRAFIWESYVNIPDKSLLFASIIRKSCIKIQSMENPQSTQYELISKVVDAMLKEILKDFSVLDYEEIIANVVEDNNYQMNKVANYVRIKFTSLCKFDDMIENLKEKCRLAKEHYENPLLIVIFAAIVVLAFTSHFNKITLLYYFSVPMIVYGILADYNGKLRKVYKQLKAARSYSEYYGQFERLGMDTIQCHVAQNIADWANPEKLNLFIPAITDYRISLTEKTGFVLPTVRIMDSKDFEEGVKFYIRGNEVCHVKFYPKKYVIFEKTVKDESIELPKKAIKCEYQDETYYWVNEKFCKELNKDFYITSKEFIKYLLNDITYRYLDRIFTIEELWTLLELYKTEDSVPDIIVDNLFIVKDICVEILKMEGSLKDLVYVIEKISKLLKKSKDPKYIAFSICQDLKFGKNVGKLGS